MLVALLLGIAKCNMLCHLIQVAEILKDRPSWFRDCRAVDVLNAMSTGNGGTIELLYMQVSLSSLRALFCP